MAQRHANKIYVFSRSANAVPICSAPTCATITAYIGNKITAVTSRKIVTLPRGAQVLSEEPGRYAYSLTTAAQKVLEDRGIEFSESGDWAR